MRRRLVLLLAAVALALAGAGAAIFVWRMPRPKPTPKIVAPIEVKPAPQAAPAPHVSTIIDAPGDPALVRRTALKAPREISFAAPVKLGGPSEETSAFYIEEPLTPASGGFLGKFAANGLASDALNVELALNASAESGEAGDDDDGGDLTPENVEAAPAPVANSQQLDVIAGGENGRPQIKQAILRPKIAQKISALLNESGYEPTSAEEVEASAKKLFNVQSLRDGAVALAIGALNPSGAYRCAQLAI